MLTMFRLSVFACLAATAAPLTAFRPLSYGGSASRPPSYALSRGQRSATPLRATPELAAGWVSEVDQASGQTFYFNSQTGESQWEPPRSTAAFAPSQSTTVVPFGKWGIDGVSGVAGFSGVEGVTIDGKFHRFAAAHKFAGSLHTEHDDDAHRLEFGREGRPCQLPYLLGAGEEKLLSRHNMIEPKHSVGRGQCKILCTADGAAVLTSVGEFPTLWRSAGGPWNMLHKYETQALSDGDQVSLDYNDPEAAVFVCTAGGGGQSQQPTGMTGGQQAASSGWVAQVDEASGETFYLNSQTGETQWEPPPTGPTGGQATGWVAQVDEASGETFYVNSQTGEAQWEPPPQW